MANAFITRLRKAYEAAHELVAEKGWDRYAERPYPRWHQFAHFCVMVIKSFVRNKCPLRATALSYSTLLAMVPLLAIGASITSAILKERGEEATQNLIQQFVKTVAPQLQLLSRKEVGAEVEGPRNMTATDAVALPDQSAADATGATQTSPPASPAQKMGTNAADAVVQQLNQAISNFHSKTIAGFGLLGFIVVAILLLSTIEDTFNDIWGVTTGRAWFRRLVQYWTAISLGPIVLVLAVYLTQTTQFGSVQHFLLDKPIFALGLKLVPYLTISLGFALFYKLMPNTQVEWKAAFVAGFVGGSLWWLNSIISAKNLGKVIDMSKLYGPLAIIPLFLIGLYFSWLIMLFGAQVAYALQNRKIYLQEKKTEGISQRGREFVALRIMLDIAQRFEMQTTPPTIMEIADHLGVPSRLVGRLLQPLIECRLVVEVAGEDASYAPARPIDTITCHDVLEALRAGREVRKELETEDEPARELLRREFDKIQDAEQKVSAALTIKDLACHAASRSVMVDKNRAGA